MKHTNGPWSSEYDDNGFYFVRSESVPVSPYIVATGGESLTDKANIETIAKAVNLHEDLMKIAEESYKVFSNEANYPQGTTGHYINILLEQLFEKAASQQPAE